MLLSNTEYIPGHRVNRHLGLVQGSTVRAKHLGRDLMAGLKNIMGGELKGYTELLNESRQQAIERMQQQAKRRATEGSEGESRHGIHRHHRAGPARPGLW